jgi:YHS domain-containing protein
VTTTPSTTASAPETSSKGPDTTDGLAPAHAARDAVCGKNLLLSDGTPVEEYAGIAYYFCSQGCLDRFTQDADIFTSFTTGMPAGKLATHDRGRRRPARGNAKNRRAGHAIFEMAQSGAGPG